MYLFDSFQLWRRLVRHEAVSVHFDLGLRAFETRDMRRVTQNRIALAMLPEAGPHSLEYLSLLWRERWLENKQDEALTIGRQLVERFPEDADAVLELAQMLTDAGRPDEASIVLMSGVEKNPGDADLWFELGLAAERAENEPLRLKSFQEVWRLEHDEEPDDRLFLSEEAFVRVVEETVEGLPDHVRDVIGNLAVIIEDYPERWVVDDGIADPRILGLFMGSDTSLEGSVEAVSDGPSRIYLYRWNIERQCPTLEDVEREIRITVLHEIGHYLGLDEEALEARGLS